MCEYVHTHTQTHLYTCIHATAIVKENRRDNRWKEKEGLEMEKGSMGRGAGYDYRR